ncbi:MAG: PIG-L family deacetylase [Alphaproteobacteria bacterium]|nr:PIG-L family deacetylase [Alphaproteobacteria bacterium]
MNPYLRSVFRFGENILHKSYSLCGSPHTFQTRQGPLLIIAPHPDDETLGCGAAILSAKQANRVVKVIVISDGAKTNLPQKNGRQSIAQRRVQEVTTACTIMGLSAKDVIILGYPDKQTHQNKDKIKADLRRLILEINPVEICSPYLLDRHVDHVATAQIVHALCVQGIISCPVYEYPMWFSLRDIVYRLTHPFTLRQTKRVATQNFLFTKKRAFLAHQTQCVGTHEVDHLHTSIWARHFGPYELFFLNDPQLANDGDLQ